jgi:CheY-like chemotaxis protein
MSPRILFVDDDPNLLQAMWRVLRVMHPEWRAAFAENGHEATKLMAQSVFDVIVTDIFMPGKEGLELIRDLRVHYPEVRIIAMSGGGQRGNLRFLDIAKTLGAHRTLSKPFTPHEMIEAVREVLQSQEVPVGSPCGARHGERKTNDETYPVRRR